MEIHAVHLPHLRNGISGINTRLEAQHQMLEQLIGMKEEVAGVNNHLETIAKTLEGFGKSVIKALLSGFGLMLTAGCVILVVAIIAITKIEFHGKGAGFETSIGQTK